MGRARMGLLARLRTVNRDLDAMVARTPQQRDRYVDFLRVFAIGVVVVWHWCLSILHWSDGHWAMPNPISEVPGGWLATWLLQIMPVFFIVGGYANSAAWWAAQRRGPGPERTAGPERRPRTTPRTGRGLSGYYRARLQRLLVPIAVFVAVWAVFELAVHLAVPGYPGVLSYGLIVFTPLWFIAAYVWVVLLTPLTASAHARARWLTIGVLAGAVALADLGRFAAGVDPLGWVNTALVWVLIHQLGCFYRDWTCYRDGTLTRTARWIPVALVIAGVAVLAVLTALDAYPRSMVATIGQDRSNILPTTVTIAAVAVTQLGVIMLLRTRVTRWLRGRAVWKPVVAANSVVMTVFLWHMTALVVVLAVVRWAGADLVGQPTAAWWVERPLWLLAPVPVLAVLVAIFGRFERSGVTAAPVGR